MTRSATTIPDTPLRDPAEIYDTQFVPALFRQFGPVVCEAAGIAAGQRVLDVGCGTGALTLAVAERVAPGGRVIGLDPNPQMLAVARRKDAPVDWREGRAEELPFADGAFDAVVSQFAMMFFDDPATALAEMGRVLRARGRLAVAVCDALEASPGYAAFARLLERLFGHAVADAFRAPFALGDVARLAALARAAGLHEARIERREGAVRFASVDALLSTERACVWTLGGLLDEEQFGRLRREAPADLAPFMDAAGRVAFSMPVVLVLAGRG